jgi:hypothetical protein
VEQASDSTGATGGVGEPAASWRKLWEAPAREKGRTRGTKFCALLRDRWDETNASTSADEYSQALADSPGRLQLEPDLSLDAGSREATRAEKSACIAFSATVFPAR